jgi:preprotein translocase subunit SecE
MGGVDRMAKVSPAQFMREVRVELAKVTWPSRKELIYTTASVFVMSALAAVFFLLVDEIIGMAVRFILGLGT